MFVAAGVVVSLLAVGGSYFGLRSTTGRNAANSTPVSTPAVSAPAPASEISTIPATASKSAVSSERKTAKTTKPAGVTTAAAKPEQQAEDEVAVTLSRDAAVRSPKPTETSEAPAAPSVTGIGNGSGAIDSVTALAGAPTTRVDTEARAVLASSPTATGVTGGQLLRRVAPVYPDFARRSGITGTVVLSGTVTKEGAVKHIKVISGNSLLADAAVRAVNAWRYSPFVYNGKPVETETRIVLNFNH
jgi:TonB family protein